MKLAGVVFIVVSAASMGIQFSLSLRRRCRLLSQLLRALQLLRNEISFCGTPLPQAFALMAAATDGVPASVFSGMAKAMDKHRWLSPYAAMESAMKDMPELPEGDRVRSILLELAGKLGKYDLENQLQGLDMAISQLEEERHGAEQERKLRGRTYETIGVCTGLAIGILLI